MDRLVVIKYSLAALALVASFMILSFALVSFYEEKTLRILKKATSDVELRWLDMSTNGTMVLVSGTAPNEGDRFKAINLISSIINSKSIIDEIEVNKDLILSKLNYSLEILRDDDDITLVGFVPEKIKTAKLLAEVITYC